MEPQPLRPRALALTAFVGGLTVDLVTKQIFVAEHDRLGVLLAWNHRDVELGRRALMSLVAIAVTVGLARLAAWRGLGPVRGAWVGLGLLVAGIAGNGVSPLLWGRGVPDFIDLHDGWIWNVADIEIAAGLAGGLLAIVAAALRAYVRELTARHEPA